MEHSAPMRQTFGKDWGDDGRIGNVLTIDSGQCLCFPTAQLVWRAWSFCSGLPVSAGQLAVVAMACIAKMPLFVSSALKRLSADYRINRIGAAD